MDVTGAGVGLVILLPILLWAAIAVLVTSGRPILFRQQRPGLNGRPFTILKFRTMRELRPGEDRYRTDETRLTRLGAMLRSTSIDELPELWNVLRGEMSLVGPRPLLLEYLAVYMPEERRRHDVRPGITSWAAVHGRHVMPFQDRIALDVWYVDHRSLWLDLRIIATTLAQVLKRTDVREIQDVDEIGFPLQSHDE